MMLLGIRWGSLRTKIIAWSFVPTAIILFAVALVTFIAYQQGTETLVIERDQEVVRLSAGQLATEFTEYTDLLDSLARTADVYRGDSDVQQTALTRARNRLVIFDGGVVILDNFGRVVATQPRRPEIVGLDWANRDYFRQMVRSPQPRFSNILNDGPDGAAVIVVAVPITGEHGEFRGALAGMFRLGTTAVSAFYGDIVKQHLGETGTTYLVDGNGRIIYHSDISRVGDDFSSQPVVQQVLRGQADAVRTRDLDGRDIVAGFAPVPGTSWGLVAEETWAALTSGSRRYQRFLILLLALGLVAPAVVVTFGVRRITQPIQDLIAAAQEVARGNFGRTIRADTGDEIEELATQFNAMSAELQASYAHLEQRVADRTKELATINAIAAVASRSLDLDDIMHDALVKTLELLEFESGAMFLKDPRTGELTMGWDQGLSDEFRPIAATGVISRGPAETGDPLIIDDMFELPDVPDDILDEGYRSVASIPLTSKGQVEGVMTVGARQLRPFQPQDVDLLLSIGHQIGVALENARLFRAEQRRAEQFRVISEVGRRITSILAVDELLDQMAALIRDAFGYYHVGFGLVEGAELVTKAGAGPLADVYGPLRLKVGQEGIGGWVVKHGEPLLVPDVHQDPRYYAVTDDTRSELCVPLKKKGNVIGVLDVQSDHVNAFDESDLVVLQSLAHQAAVAIENARLFDLVQERRFEEQAALLMMSNQLLSRLDLDDLMGYLVGEVRSLLGADASTLLLPDEQSEYLRVRAANGWHQDPVAEARQIPADERSGPGLVMKTQQPLLVRDLQAEDPTPWTADWVEAEGFRGHAIVPLVAEGRSIGVLAINTRRPRLLDDDELRFLRLMANQAAIAIEKARLHQEEIKQQQLQHELEVARLIQQTQLPKELPALKGWQVAVHYQPAQAVGGDFYDFFELPDGRLGFVIGDVADKGVPAALVMASTRAIVRAAGPRLVSPGRVLKRVNEILCPDMPPNMFVTCLCAILDPATGRLRYANAGHNPPYRRINGTVDELRATGVPLGLVPEAEYEEWEVRLAPGESVLFSSDGLVEAHNPEREMFGFPRLEAFLASQPEGVDLIDVLLEELAAFTHGDGEQEDDITLVTFERSEAG